MKNKTSITSSNNVVIQIVSITIGEIYKSNEYKVSQLLENYKYVR